MSLADIGNVYLRRGELLTAISYYQRMLELVRQLDDQLSIGKGLRFGQVYAQFGSPAPHRFEKKANLVNDRLVKERGRAESVGTRSSYSVPEWPGARDCHNDSCAKPVPTAKGWGAMVGRCCRLGQPLQCHSRPIRFRGESS